MSNNNPLLNNKKRAKYDGNQFPRHLVNNYEGNKLRMKQHINLYQKYRNRKLYRNDIKYSMLIKLLDQKIGKSWNSVYNDLIKKSEKSRYALDKELDYIFNYRSNYIYNNEYYIKDGILCKNILKMHSKHIKIKIGKHIIRSNNKFIKGLEDLDISKFSHYKPFFLGYAYVKYNDRYLRTKIYHIDDVDFYITEKKEEIGFQKVEIPNTINIYNQIIHQKIEITKVIDHYLNGNPIYIYRYKNIGIGKLRTFIKLSETK